MLGWHHHSSHESQCDVEEHSDSALSSPAIADSVVNDRGKKPDDVFSVLTLPLLTPGSPIDSLVLISSGIDDPQSPDSTTQISEASPSVASHVEGVETPRLPTEVLLPHNAHMAPVAGEDNDAKLAVVSLLIRSAGVCLETGDNTGKTPLMAAATLG